jgi:hypothetical protein
MRLRCGAVAEFFITRSLRDLVSSQIPPESDDMTGSEILLAVRPAGSDNIEVFSSGAPPARPRSEKVRGEAIKTG